MFFLKIIDKTGLDTRCMTFYVYYFKRLRVGNLFRYQGFHNRLVAFSFLFDRKVHPPARRNSVPSLWPPLERVYRNCKIFLSFQRRRTNLGILLKTPCKGFFLIFLWAEFEFGVWKNFGNDKLYPSTYSSNLFFIVWGHVGHVLVLPHVSISKLGAIFFIQAVNHETV